MDQLLQPFENAFTGNDGEVYDVQLWGRSRPADTWQGWIVFVRRRDGTTFATDVETTQPSSDAVLYWATGLTSTYFDGAFARAQKPASHAAPVAAPPPLRDATADRATYLARLSLLERDILAAIERRGTRQVATQSILEELPHANADVVRALEDLEKRHRLLVRTTEGGNDWLMLT